jgi:hypothetical protein
MELCPVFLHRVRRSNRLYIREPVDTRSQEDVVTFGLL